jgi:hypothetical protein
MGKVGLINNTVIHTFQFKLVFLSKVSLVYITFVSEDHNVAGNSFIWLLFLIKVFLDPSLFKMVSVFWVIAQTL